MNQDRTEQLIRDVFADQAARAVDGRDVLDTLRGEPRRRYGVVLATAAVAVVVVAVAAFVVPEVFRRGSPPPPVAEQPRPAAAGPTSVLVGGLDAEGRTDTLALAQVHEDGAVSLVSLPRDSWVHLPEGPPLRISQVRMFFDTDKLLDVVRDLTGVRPEHYAFVDMAAFADLADAVGGVRVCLNAPAEDPFAGVDLPAGEQVVTGDAALGFVRQRHGLPNGDLDRVRRAQVFLQGVVAKLGDADLTELIDAVAGRLQSDSGLDLLGLAGQLAAAPSLHVGTIPVIDGAHEVPGAGSVVAVDPAEVTSFVAGLQGTPPSDGVPCIN
ncbi:LCP family protein [Actinophytocola glycyrrhizae]|uniref:LCP family protein n=1 Tax=Actinophytocola glycyrrhizae TaxID=2044873 RepID=A0ABV9RY18_9PSEU